LVWICGLGEGRLIDFKNTIILLTTNVGSDLIMNLCIRLQLGRIQNRLSEHQDVTLSYDEAAVDLIASRCTELESGGRMVDAILTNTVLPEVSRELLNRLMEGTSPQKIGIRVQDGTFAYEYA
jgi:type VI secretion system protein VasG